MQAVITLIAVVSGAIGQAAAKDVITVDVLPPAAQKCIDDFDLDKDYLNKYLKEVTVPLDAEHKYKCGLQCYLKNIDLMFEDNTWHLDNLYRYSTDSDRKVIESCVTKAATKKEDKCEESFVLIHCLVEKMSAVQEYRQNT